MAVYVDTPLWAAAMPMYSLYDMPTNTPQLAARPLLVREGCCIFPAAAHVDETGGPCRLADAEMITSCARTMSLHLCRRQCQGYRINSRPRLLSFIHNRTLVTSQDYSKSYSESKATKCNTKFKVWTSGQRYKVSTAFHLLD